ncbi:FAD-dependent oxidoreductase [Roseomonas sp. ACRSG]|nr:FAD-dependent oxidoreductase [Roseomonas sp. ACRSG]
MARPSLASLEGQDYDVLVIGGGVNGASTAQHLAAAGYAVLLVDKGDFGAGSSSRSSRILGNGMHYLAGGHSPWDFLFRPRRFLAGCRMARFALASRAQMVKTMPERLQRVEFCFPIYEDGLYRPWQFDAGMAVLRALGTHGVGLGYHRIPGPEAVKRPLLQWLREPEKIASVAVFDQYQFRWPERVVIDTVLNAEDLGATIRNYTEVTSLSRLDDGRWAAGLRDVVQGGAAQVEAKLVLNMAGIWIDRVNGLGPAHPSRKIMGTKGIHIAIRLPPECRDACVTWQNRHNEHMYVLPWNGLHYLGPTEVVYEGDLDDIHPTEAEIAWVIDEVAHMLPGMPLKRQDVVYAWAGVRPWTHSPEAPKGLRSRVLHDMAAEGMPGVMALTGGPVMSHRSAGRDACAAVEQRLPPSGPKRAISYAARLAPATLDSPLLLNGQPQVTMAELRHAAATEHPVTLSDLLFRRLLVGWSESMGQGAAQQAAQSVADILGWDEERVEQEVNAYHARLRHLHLMEPA